MACNRSQISQHVMTSTLIDEQRENMGVLEYIRAHAVALPLMAKFALGMVMICGIPPLALMCTTATLGLVLTQHFAPRMLADAATKGDLLSRGE